MLVYPVVCYVLEHSNLHQFVCNLTHTMLMPASNRRLRPWISSGIKLWCVVHLRWKHSSLNAHTQPRCTDTFAGPSIIGGKSENKSWTMVWSALVKEVITSVLKPVWIVSGSWDQTVNIKAHVNHSIQCRGNSSWFRLDSKYSFQLSGQQFHLQLHD